VFFKEREIKIAVRVTEQQKERIKNLSQRCGLSQAEYIRQRALGYEPAAAVPDTFYLMCEKLDALMSVPFSSEVNERAKSVLNEMEKRFLLPGKENMKNWQPQDSGR